jgi:hypothetical protein
VASPQPEPSNASGRAFRPPKSLALTGSSSGSLFPDAVWLTVCAWCTRVKRNGQWGDHETVVADGIAHLTHGICPPCLTAVMRQADAARRRRRSA